MAIARALITKPAIVLLDEPLCNLDIQLRIEMRTEMAQLFHSLHTTVFHVTHDPSEAFAMADRIVVMNRGEIDQMDTPEVCYRQPKTSMVAGLLGAGNRLSLGSVLSRMGEYCQVSISGTAVEGLDFLSENRRTDDDGDENKNLCCACELRFRAEDCGFQEEKGVNTIPVTVIMSTFEGGIYRVKVKTPEEEEVCLLCSEFLESGKRGYVKIDRKRLYVYEKSYQ